MKPLSDMGRFATVVIDPPWPHKPMSYANHADNNYDKELRYQTMTIAELGAMPIRSVLADDALVFCWTVNRFVRDAFDLMDSWGLSYSFLMTWIKTRGIQLPNTPMFNAEQCIVGRVGNPRYIDQRQFFTANRWPSQAHSEKPDGFYDLLRRVTPEPRLDIFGRRPIGGFRSWGNEAPEGEPPPGYYQDVLDIEYADTP